MDVGSEGFFKKARMAKLFLQAVQVLDSILSNQGACGVGGCQVLFICLHVGRVAIIALGHRLPEVSTNGGID